MPGVSVQQPPLKSVICVKKEFLKRVPSKRIWGNEFSEQFKYGISFWSGVEEGEIPMNTFFSRRKKIKLV